MNLPVYAKEQQVRSKEQQVHFKEWQVRSLERPALFVFDFNA